MREPQLEAQVVAAPDDDGPRQVYADWLLEREDPRGEFIVVQLALHHLQGEPARLPADPRRAALEQRERELLAAHGAQWLTELGFPGAGPVTAATSSTSEQHARGSVVVFRRGFVDEAKVTLPQFMDVRPSLTAIPLRRLVFTDVSEAHRPELAALGGFAPCPTLTALCFRRLWLSSEQASLLAATPLLDTVQVLELQQAHLTDGVQVLASDRLRKLRKLGLIRSTTEGLETLAESLSELVELDLEGSDSPVLWGLFRSERLGRLEVLSLRGSRADDAVVGAVASSRRPLTHLDLSGWSKFGDEGVQSLLRTRQLSRLEVLRLTEHRLTADHLLALRRKFGDKLVLDNR